MGVTLSIVIQDPVWWDIILPLVAVDDAVLGLSVTAWRFVKR